MKKLEHELLEVQKEIDRVRVIIKEFEDEQLYGIGLKREDEDSLEMFYDDLNHYLQERRILKDKLKGIIK